MKTRPLALTLFCVILFTVGLSIPIQAAYLENIGNLFRSMTALNFTVMILCLATAVATFHVHKSLRYLIPLTLTTVVFNNWWVGYVGFDFSMNQTTIASLAFAGLCCSLLERNTFSVLRDPKLKWWNVAARKKLDIAVSLRKFRGGVLVKRAHDISESGVFLHGFDNDDFKNYSLGERVELDLHFNEILKIRCEAKIVRKSHKQGTYPSGLGIQFIQSKYATGSTIKKLVREAAA